MAETKSKILIVEDDLDVADMLNAYFRVQGYDVFTANWGEDGVRAASASRPDMIILDIRLPDIDGYEVARRLRSDRKTNTIPIIFLTEKRDRADRLHGLELGADDYITKPFSPKELVARVRVLFRRIDNYSLADNQVFRAADLTLDVPRMRVMAADRNLEELTPTEFELLVAMARHPGRVFTRAQLLDAVHGVAFESYERAIDAHIKNIRHKIELSAGEPHYILTVYGVGYKFTDQ